ncbi:MAG: response regulator transcription factor [Flavobacteriales bacterium]|nr:response regulator transcription factor [Flavobacteriales bacterium]
MSMHSLRIAIVDDHRMVCYGISAMLNTWPRGEVILLAANGADYEQAIANVGRVDIALIDACMPVRDGFSTLEWMRTNQHDTLPIMLLCYEPSPEEVSKAVKLGARSMISKSIDKEELHQALDQVSTTGYYMNELMRSHLTGRTKTPASFPEGREQVIRCLTKREMEVIEEICAHDDPTYAMVAERMKLSTNTIHAHRASIFEKLGVSNRQGLLRAAFNWKLLRRSR